MLTTHQLFSGVQCGDIVVPADSRNPGVEAIAENTAREQDVQ